MTKHTAHNDYIYRTRWIVLIRKFIDGEAAVKREGVKFYRILIN